MTELCRQFGAIESKIYGHIFFLIIGIQITFVRIVVILADKRNTDEEFRTE